MTPIEAVLVGFGVAFFIAFFAMLVEEVWGMWQFRRRPHLCESCRRRPASGKMWVNDDLFWICDRCRP